MFAPRTPILPMSTRLGTSYTPLTNTPRSRPSPGFRPFSSSRQISNQNPGSSLQTDPRLSLPPNATLSQRLKHLIKTYGWYALGIYFAIGFIDFGVAFAGIQLIGAEHVSRVAAAAKSAVLDALHSKPPEPGHVEMDRAPDQNTAGGQEGLYAIIILAWTVHKTLFLPLRVGLTAGLTPKVVGWLAKRGWIGREGTKRAADQMRERIRNKTTSKERNES